MDSAHAQADLGLHFTHMPEDMCTFSHGSGHIIWLKNAMPYKALNKRSTKIFTLLISSCDVCCTCRYSLEAPHYLRGASNEYPLYMFLWQIMKKKKKKKKKKKNDKTIFQIRVLTLYNSDTVTIICCIV